MLFLLTRIVLKKHFSMYLPASYTYVYNGKPTFTLQIISSRDGRDTGIKRS